MVTNIVLVSVFVIANTFCLFVSICLLVLRTVKFMLLLIVMYTVTWCCVCVCFWGWEGRGHKVIQLSFIIILD